MRSAPAHFPGVCDNTSMFAVLLALLVQSSTILSGELVAPNGMSVPGTARVVLLPSEYAQIFNAEAQRRIDNYWEQYKPTFAVRKEDFSQALAAAYKDALDAATNRLSSEGKINSSSLVKTASNGHFEFRVPPGEYRIVATGNIGGTTYVWTEPVQLKAGQVSVLMKQYVP
jgi:hypothetical protein